MTSKEETEETKFSDEEESDFSPDRDYFVVSHINEWMPNFLPPGFEDLTKWDVFESIHCDNVSIVEVGATLYNSDTKKKSKKVESELQSFLADSDASENDDTNHTTEVLTTTTTESQSQSQSFIPDKIETFRLVLQFENDSPTNDNNDEMPQCVAVYYKQNKKWRTKYVNTEAFDPDLHPICVAEELNDVEEADISTLLAPLSKKQIVSSIVSFIAKKPQHSKYLGLEALNASALKSIHRIRSELNRRDRDNLELICVRLVCTDNDIIDEFSTHFEDEMKESMDDFQSSVFEGNLEPILDSLSDVLKMGKSMRESEHIYSAIKSVSNVTKQLIKYLRKCCAEIDDNADNDGDSDDDSNADNKCEIWNRNELMSNGKLNFIIGDLEKLWEKLCKNCELDSKGRSTLESLFVNMSGWKDDISPILGPIFSDNLRMLQKRLRKNDLETSDDLKMPPAKKRRIE